MGFEFAFATCCDVTPIVAVPFCFHSTWKLQDNFLCVLIYCLDGFRIWVILIHPSKHCFIRFLT